MTISNAHKAEVENDIEKLELKISYLLRYGVFVSAFFLALACIALFFTNKSLTHLAVYRPLSLFDTIRGAWGETDIFTLSALLGLSILVALPIIRVALTAYLFVRNREFALALMAVFVSLVLVFSFFLGIEL